MIFTGGIEASTGSPSPKRAGYINPNRAPSS
jgi:hypothetical protein